MLRHLLRSILTSVYQKVKKMIFKKLILKYLPRRIWHSMLRTAYFRKNPGKGNFFGQEIKILKKGGERY
jgi:hypothetical protein